MIFEDYKVNDFYTSVKEQHNIMVFMGNGFDISVLRKYGNGNSVPSYVEFYDYLIKHKYGKNNLLVKQMKIDKKINVKIGVILKQLWGSWFCRDMTQKY